ncbi:S-layer homology domain-containing protein [Paenibacillus rigui]|nr:S-layer homology domain-containing protein [Paenibacillus rigui]
MKRGKKPLIGKVILLACMLSSAAGSMLVSQEVQARTVYESTQSSTDLKVEGSSYQIAGNQAAWLQLDAAGIKQVWLEDRLTGGKEQITTGGGPKMDLAFNGALLVWNDKRDQDPLGTNWDVYAYDTAARQERKLNSRVGQHVQFSLDGKRVVWYDANDFGRVYMYDFDKRTEQEIGPGRVPALASNKIMFKNARDGGLSLYDIATGQTQKVLELPYSQYVSSFAFNGTTVVWQQTNLDHDAKYMIGQTTGTAGGLQQTKQLTPAAQFSQFRGDLVIGPQYAVWVQDRNGAKQMVGTDLLSGATFDLSILTGNERPWSFDGNHLLSIQDNGTIERTTITSREVSDSRRGNNGPILSPGSSTQSSALIGPEGGQLNVKDSSVKLVIAPGTFSIPVKVQLQAAQASDEDKLGPGYSYRSLIWELSADQPFAKPAVLTVDYDTADLQTLQVPKQAVYSYSADHQAWHVIGGKITADQNIIETHISGAGRFAVLLHVVTFEDLQDHWAQQSVEILASRSIVSGIDDLHYAPDASLTRAQFTKMLMGAVGIVPDSAKQTTFSDVPQTHWGHDWIEAAAKAGIAEGNQGSFAPDALVTREQMMTMLYRAMNGKPSSQADKSELAVLQAFSDAGQVSEWAEASVAMAVKQGLLEGNGEGLAPQQSSTRAQAAAVIVRMLIMQNKL